MINIVICEDDNLIKEQMSEYIIQYFKENQISYELTSFALGGEVVKSKGFYHIALLDIEIGDISGIDVAWELKKTNPRIAVIFTTAHMDYVYSAFDLHAFQYMKKPVFKEELFLTLDKVMASVNSSLKTILIVDESKNKHFVKVNSIIYIEICQRKTKIVTEGETYETKEKIEYWAEQLREFYFAQPHKSYLVNLQKVNGFNRQLLKLKIKDTVISIPVSRNKYEDFNKAFDRMEIKKWKP